MGLPKYSHIFPEGAIEKAEKLARYQHEGTLGYAYRMVDARNGDGSPYIGLIAYSIKSITPSGITIPFLNSKGYRTVADHMMLRAFAHRTVADALQSYIRRKNYHIIYTERRLREVQRLRLMAQNKGASSISEEETADSFELTNEPLRDDEDLVPQDKLNLSVSMGLLPRS